MFKKDTYKEVTTRFNRTAKFGFVKFPIKDPEYEFTNEGGTFVKLVVLEERGILRACSNANVVDHDDAFCVNPLDLDKFCLASIVIGSTGWTGYDDKKKDYWKCEFKHLTFDGRKLFQKMVELFPGARVKLLTFLDLDETK